MHVALSPSRHHKLVKLHIYHECYFKILCKRDGGKTHTGAAASRAGRGEVGVTRACGHSPRPRQHASPSWGPVAGRPGEPSLLSLAFLSTDRGPQGAARQARDTGLVLPAGRSGCSGRTAAHAPVAPPSPRLGWGPRLCPVGLALMARAPSRQALLPLEVQFVPGPCVNRLSRPSSGPRHRTSDVRCPCRHGCSPLRPLGRALGLLRGRGGEGRASVRVSSQPGGGVPCHCTNDPISLRATWPRWRRESRQFNLLDAGRWSLINRRYI